MKKILTAALVAGGMLILPVAAATPAAASVPAPNCPAGTAAGPFTVYTGTGVDGAPGVVGVCSTELGYLEVGATYVVAQSNQFGYVGVSNYESGSHRCTPVKRTPGDPTDPSEGGSGSNGGGCYGTDETFIDLRTGTVYAGGQTVATPVVVPQAVPLPVCGDGTGPFTSSSRDGCRAEAKDVDDAVAEVVALLS